MELAQDVARLGVGEAAAQQDAAGRQTKKVVQIATRNTSVMPDPILKLKLKSPLSSGPPYHH